MGWNRPRIFTSWSFTRWNDWRECPARAAWNHLDKKEQHAINAGILTKSPALARGADIDKKTEDFLTGKLKTIPIELKPAANELKLMKKVKHKIIQDNWGFDSKWNPVSPTDWNNCKLRIKIDFGEKVNTHLSITDTKTGSFKEDMNEIYEMQLDLYVAGGFAALPDIKTADARLLYTDHNIVFPDASDMQKYTRAEGEKMQKAWDKRVKPMLADTTFRPRPGNYCSWCPYRSGGVRMKRDGTPARGGEIGGCKF